MNNNGDMVGFYTKGTTNYAFEYQEGGFTTLVIPNCAGGFPIQVNNLSHIVGFCPSNGASFVKNGDNVIKFSLPGASSTQAFGINDSDQIVGQDDACGSEFSSFAAMPTKLVSH